MTTHLIDSQRLERQTLWVRPCSEFGARFLADDYWVVYGDPRVDLETLTAAEATMPFTLVAGPVAWASGDRWLVPELDAVQAERLPGARDTFRSWYPGNSWDGELIADRATTAPERPDGPDVILFSGGLDSHYSALSSPPGAVLLLLRGLDVALDNAPGWARVRRAAEALAERAGHDLITAETSMKRHLRKDAVDAMHGSYGGWWARVQHGLAIAGLGIPVAAALGRGRVLMPASLWAGEAQPLGSAPEIDESASWSGGEVVHHGFDMTRHDKLRWVLEHSERPVFLRVCYSDPHGAGGNCLTCEKCLRTALALMVEGTEPLPFGLPLAPREVERRLREGAESEAFGRIASVVPYWVELQARVAEHPGLVSPGFRDWLLAQTDGIYGPAATAA